MDVPDGLSAGGGLILGFIASLVLAGGAIAAPAAPAAPGRSRPGPQAGRPAALRRPAARWLRLPRRRSRRSGCAAALLRHSAAAGAGRAAVRAAAAGARSGRGLLAVLVRRAGGPPAVRGRRFAVADRRTARRVPGTWPSSSAVPPSSRRRRTAGAASFRTPRGSSAAEPRTVSHGPSPFRAGAVVVQSQPSIGRLTLRQISCSGGDMRLGLALGYWGAGPPPTICRWRWRPSGSDTTPCGRPSRGVRRLHSPDLDRRPDLNDQAGYGRCADGGPLPDHHRDARPHARPSLRRPGARARAVGAAGGGGGGTGGRSPSRR